jgi:hypothetical protein
MKILVSTDFDVAQKDQLKQGLVHLMNYFLKMI